MECLRKRYLPNWSEEMCKVKSITPVTNVLQETGIMKLKAIYIAEMNYRKPSKFR